MLKNKRVLLIAGDGTLGMYTAENLISAGVSVDIICLDMHTSQNENLRFFQMDATLPNLTAFLKDNHYNGIVNFLHYPDAAEYPAYHKLLCEHAEHLIVLSSYRVYADEMHPVTEKAPQLLDVSEDTAFVEQETYAISKARMEKLIREDKIHTNWTIVRPVISFSDKRFDLFMYSGQEITDALEKGTPLYLPNGARKLTAGWDWAGNSGKLIANLLFRETAKGEAFTISSAQNLTWEQVAELYQKVIGIDILWVEEDVYFSHAPNAEDAHWQWRYVYDRMFDRDIDNSKILAVTGLRKEDFRSVEEGLRLEWGKRSS
ncbi:MAG: NAD-dependent epimerase/dehydratase family protein [Clostridia bacterium]|nr:NAD-dependent epimerase/dehydratase family protein [Clostridia bacterium]